MDPLRSPDDAEDVVVVRFEGLGTYALPVADLESYRLPVLAEPSGDLDVRPSDAIPVILGEDFLRGLTPDRRRLVVDRFGGVSRLDQRPIFDTAADPLGPDAGAMPGEGGTPPFPG